MAVWGLAKCPKCLRDVALTEDGQRIWRHDPDVAHRPNKLVSCPGSWGEPAGGPRLALGRVLTEALTLFELGDDAAAA